MALVRLLETVRRLRPDQAAAQIAHRIRPYVEARAPARNPPGLPEIRLPENCGFVRPRLGKNTADSLRKGLLTFLNRTEIVGWFPTWDLPRLPTLWRYNFHYHDFLWALPPEEGLAVAIDWIRKYPNGRDRAGWDPYPISIRIQNWCTYFFAVRPNALLSDADRTDDVWRSIYEQLSWLEDHIERHLLGNHIIENAAALALAGATFGGAVGERWLDGGLNLLRRHLPDMVLSDGGHAERSPMYHARLCGLLQNLVQTRNDRLVATVQPYLERTRVALAHLCHPDHEIALLNDAAFGVYPGLGELNIVRPNIGSFELPESGYYGSMTESGHYVVCDAGPIGPDYQPGHAHGDTLSFEMSLGGVRFIVDAGVFGYEQDGWRAYARSTRAHNTVEVNRLDQSDFWGAFRVGRRAYPRDVKWNAIQGGFSLEAGHTGYAHLAGSPTHRRLFRWHDDGVLMVRDRVRSGRPVWTRSVVHLHPDVEIESFSGTTVRLSRGNVRCNIVFAGAGHPVSEPSWYFPEFGRRLQNKALVVTAKGSNVVNGFCIAEGDESVQFDLESGTTINGREYGW